MSPLATATKVLAAIVAVTCISGVSIVAIAAWDVASQVKPGIHLEHFPVGDVPEEISAISGEVNLLLTGTDTRTGQRGALGGDLLSSSGIGHNDVTMLLHISADHTNAAVISFPRDLIIPIPSCTASDGTTTPTSAAAMINTTLSRGGLSCTVRTVESLTGVHIPFAAKITMTGVIAMSNAVGGVTVCLASPVVDNHTSPRLNLAAGPHTLRGGTALSFLRTRHGIGDGSDLGRISNQQVFLSALVRKVKSAGVLNNPLALYPLARAAVTNMEFSDTLTDPRSLVKVGLALKAIDLSRVVFLQYPTVDDPFDPNRVIPNITAAGILKAALQADQPIRLSGNPGVAAVRDPTAQSPTPSTSSAPSEAPSASLGPSPSSTTPPTVTLPKSVTGQSAADLTCTKGNG